jgi:1-deoxy-D-xylulose-5-phosphate reductoisomerase
VLNAANEVAVHAFLAGRISFPAIPAVIESTLAELPGEAVTAFESLYDADRRAREIATRVAGELG